MVPMDSCALLLSPWIDGHCCSADGLTVIVAVPMDSQSLLWCQWIHGNCCGAVGLREIVVEPMDSKKLLRSRCIHGNCCGANRFTGNIFFFFFVAVGPYCATWAYSYIISGAALYLEPRTRPYEICIYHHLSFALSVELPVSSGLQDPQQLLVRPA